MRKKIRYLNKRTYIPFFEGFVEPEGNGEARRKDGGG
jgi:hypothetical protein